MLSILKMLFLPNLIHDFTELPTKIILGISVVIDKLIFKKHYMKMQRATNTQDRRTKLEDVLVCC